MSRDLMSQLDAYFSEVDEGQGPVTVDQVADVLERVRELPTPAPVTVRQRPKVWVAAAAAAMVVVAVGLVPLLVGSQDTDTPPATEPPVSTTAAPNPTPAMTLTEGSIEVTVEGIEGRSGGHLAGVLFEGVGTLYPDSRAMGGFAVRVDSDPFTATELVRTPIVRTPRARGAGPEVGLFPDVTEEILVVEPGTYTLMLWLADTTISYYSRWVPALEPNNLDGCETVFEVEEGQGASLTVTGGFADVQGGNMRCTTAPTPTNTPTIPSTTTTVAPATTTAARADGAVFNPADHNLCDWFTPEELTSIVADAYTTHGIAPIPDAAALDCHETESEGWPDDFDSYTNLETVTSGQEAAWARNDAVGFEPYDGLDPSIQVRNLSPGCTAYTPGVSADLMVDGHDTTLSFVHFMPRGFRTFTTFNGCDGDVVNPAGLAIAESMLRHIGWIE